MKKKQHYRRHNMLPVVIVNENVTPKKKRRKIRNADDATMLCTMYNTILTDNNKRSQRRHVDRKRRNVQTKSRQVFGEIDAKCKWQLLFVIPFKWQ